MREACPRTIQLSAHLDGEQSPAEHARLLSHVAVCPQCGAMLANLNALRDGFRGLPDEPLGFDLSEVIRGRIATSVRRPVVPSWRRRWLQWAPMGLGAGAALSLGLLMGTGLMAGSAGIVAPRVTAMAMFDPVAPGNLCGSRENCFMPPSTGPVGIR